MLYPLSYWSISWSARDMSNLRAHHPQMDARRPRTDFAIIAEKQYASSESGCGQRKANALT